MAGEMDPKAAEELAKSAQHLKEATDATTRSFNEQLRIITQMRDAINKMSQSMSEMCTSPTGGLSPETLREVTKELEKGTSAMGDQAAMAKKLSDTYLGRLSKGFAVVGVLLTGLKQGFSNIVALGKGVFNLFMSVADGLWSVTKAVIAVPFKMMQGLFKMAGQGGGDTAYAQALENIRKEYGSLQSDSAMAIKTAARDLRTLDLGGMSTYRIFGNAAQQLEAVTKMAQGMGASFQVFGDEVMKNGAAMAAYNKGLGITDEMMSGIASNAMRMGKGITDIQNDMTKQALGMSKAFGVNAKVISRDMGKAMQDLAHFGHLSTNELAIAATFANKLGVSVDKLTGIMDATSTYDQAAEGMSKLNEQYGTNIDATEIMSAQNPAEKLEILRKEFAKTGKDMSSLTYQDRMLIKSTSGLTDELMDAAFSAKNANVNLSDIQKQGAKNERKTLSQAEAMSKLADSMERIVQSGQGEGGIFAHFMDGMKRGLMASPEFMKLMNDIRHVFRIATEAGVKLGRMFVDLFPGVKDIFSGMGKLFEPKRWKTMFAEVTKAFDVFKVGGSGKIEDFMERIKSTFSNFFAGGKGGSQQVLEGFKKFGKALLASIIMIGEWTWKKMKELYNSFTAEMKNPGETTLKIKKFFSDIIVSLSNWITKEAVPWTLSVVKALTGWLKDGKSLKDAMPAAGPLGKMMGDVLGPLGDALKNAWEVLGPPIKELAKTLLLKLKDALIDAAKFTWEHTSMMDILGTAFMAGAPAMAGAAMKAGAEALAKKGVEKIGTILKERAVKKAGEMAAEQLAKEAAEVAAKQVAKVGAESVTVAVESAATSAAAATETAVVAAGAQAATGGAAAAEAVVAASGAQAATGAAAGVAGAGLAATVAIGAAALGVGVAVGAGVDAILSDMGKKQQTEQKQKIAESWEGAMKVQDEEQKKALEKMVEEQDKLVEEHTGIFGGRTFWDAVYGKGDKKQNAELARDAAKQALKAFDPATIAMRKAAEQKMKEETAGTKEWYAKQAADRETKLAEDKKKAMDALGPVTMDNALERFKKIDQIAKKVMGKDFDIQAKIDMIREKLSGIDFLVIDANKATDMETTIANLGRVQSLMTTIADIGGTTKVAADKMTVMSKLFQKGSEELKAISDDGNLFSAIKTASKTFSFDSDTTTNIQNAVTNATSSNSLFDNLGKTAKVLKEFMDVMGALSDDTVKNKMNSMSTAITQAVLSITQHNPGLIDTANVQGPKIEEMFKKASGVSSGISDFVTSTGKYTESIVTTSVAKTTSTVTKMVSAVQTMDDALSKLGTINIGTRLDSVAKSLGIGSSGTYTVQSKEVVINVNFTIQMDAGKVEKAMLMNTESIIKDRINFALGGGQGKNAIVPETLKPGMTWAADTATNSK